MPRLHILSPNALAATIELTDNLLTIGRTPENSLCIQDTNISRRHGILVRDGDTYQLHDFNSANGTFVNGERIMAVKLQDGASIRFGPVELRYEAGLAKVLPLGIAQPEQAGLAKAAPLAAAPAESGGLAKAAPLGAAPAEEGLLRSPHKGGSGKGRGGISKRMKPEYAAGSLMSGPATIQPPK